MHLLILGRSDLLDRHVIEAALAQGHDLTLFVPERGDTHRFPEAEIIVGDRQDAHYKLAGDRWDAVIDLSARTPREMSVTTAVLSAQASHYTYVSSAWVLDRPWTYGMDESAPVQRLSRDEAISDTLTAENYTRMLAECERIVTEHFDGTTFVVRPGLVVGPEDPLDQIGSWIRRVGQGGDVIVPRLDFPVQFIDVRDLARWIVRAVEDQQEGTCLATGEASLTMGVFLSEIARVVQSDAHAVQVDDNFLIEHGVAPLTGMPLWIPEDGGAFLTLDCSEARRRKLVTRSLEETLLDVEAWDALAPLMNPEAPRMGLPPAREAELIRIWLDRVPA